MLLMLAQLVPAKSIKHQEHHLVCPLHTRWHPLRNFLSTARSENGWDQARNRATLVVGDSGRWHPIYTTRVRVSTRGDYACRALLSLALHAEDQGPTSVRDIATRTALPQPYLEQILLVLKGAGLVKSKRGVGGGYVLARPAEEILLSEIVAAADGPITLGDFGQPHQDGACDHEGHCVLLAIWNVAGEHMRHHLADYTLAKIAQAARGTAPWPELHH